MRESWMPFRAIVVVALFWSGAVGAAPKLEAWADSSLPVSPGLAVWLDSTRQPAAWQAHNKPELAGGDAMDVWYDASGNGRNFAQVVRASQPRFVAGGRSAAVRFDGENDYLSSGAGPGDLDHFTLIMAVAPKSDAGGFRAFFAANQTGKNDYLTGVNVDLGPLGSDAGFDLLNVEGRGFGGVRNLITSSTPFRRLQMVAVTGGDAGPAGIKAYLNGQLQGSRERAAAAGMLRPDGLFIGARCYSNDPAPPFVSGFLDGDVAEVLLYDRLLSEKELADVTAYVIRKHARYADDLLGSADLGEPLRSLENPPDVQIFVPGFTAHRLPLDLTNINNVRYREDGKLVALAYDGNVYVLSDTDGDGLEDKAELFWDNQGRIVAPIGMALTPPGYKAGRGLFVASKGKVSLLLDADGDGKAEREVVVAQGWKPLAHGVDALGVALGPDGSLYFGLGTTNFTNAYLTDAEGKAHYDPKDEHGAILKVSSDFTKREIVCTGIRFSVGMAFNRDGDLFATDQEGATWLPNGNPFDELLHIQPGRHYGFPPRHPTHLPGVIDEPSVFDYGPQHQSTCGLAFNEPVNGGGVFGPSGWRGDALVCGESRGKLYRTRLAKTASGYVADNHILASLTMLTVDACVSPQGDLVVCVHSGNPDWGSGPKGKGRLYKIRYAQKEQPQPVACWSAGPQEVRVAFDRPLDPSVLRDVSKNTTIEYGAHVAAGDRLEKIRPGYAVVQRQMNAPRHKLPISGAQVTSDRRTLVLSTVRQAPAAGYALTLTGFGRSTAPAADSIKQIDAVDLAFDLTGVAAEWQPADPNTVKAWSGWLPHADLDVSRAFTADSAEHEMLWRALKTPGRLTLRTSLDLWNMLRPAVQPGSRLDYTTPPERVTVTFGSDTPLEVRCAAAMPVTSTAPDGTFRASLTISPREGTPTPVEILVPSGRGVPALTASFTTAEDSHPRALPLRRFLLPWAGAAPGMGKETAAQVAQRDIPQIRGGDWLRGREVFFGAQAGCSLCHRVNGNGSDLGPDLSNLVHRDYDSVLRDIRDPSGALNPDYIASTVRLKDGRVLNGIVRDAGVDRFIVRGDADGEREPIHREEVSQIVPSAVSTMPQGLEQGLGTDRMRDLMTFLLTRPLEPMPTERTDLPPPRTRAEVNKVLAPTPAETTATAAPGKKLTILLVAGPKDHGPSEHDYPAWQQRWATLLGLAERTTIVQTKSWPIAEQWATADVAVFYSANPDWNQERSKDLDAFLARGGGLVFIHFAINGQEAVDSLAKRTGLAWRNGVSRFRHGPVELTIRDQNHPVTRGFDKVKFVDESYWNLTGDVRDVHVLADAPEEGEARPLLWTLEKPRGVGGGGRVFVCVLGHYTWTFDDPLYRLLILRGICWTAGESTDRFNGLVTIGARVLD
jgi:putative heme-binding domain-containing protein